MIGNAHLFEHTSSGASYEATCTHFERKVRCFPDCGVVDLVAQVIVSLRFAKSSVAEVLFERDRQFDKKTFLIDADQMMISGRNGVT